MFGLINYALNSTLSVLATEDLLKYQSWLFQLKAALFRTQQRDYLDTLPDELKEETDYTMFVRLAKKLMFSVGESVSLIFILTIIIIIIIFNLAFF